LMLVVTFMADGRRAAGVGTEGQRGSKRL
jgi:hypothetical protein